MDNRFNFVAGESFAVIHPKTGVDCRQPMMQQDVGLLGFALFAVPIHLNDQKTTAAFEYTQQLCQHQIQLLHMMKSVREANQVEMSIVKL